MQPKGRCSYVFDPTAERWIPWEGTTAGFGGVTLFTVAGDPVATDTNGATYDAEDGEALDVNACDYGINFTTNALTARANLSDSSDAQANLGIRFGAVASRSQGFNGTTWDRLRSFVGNADAITAPTLGLLGSAAFRLGFNGTSYDRLRTNSAATLSASTQPFAALSANPGEWSINHTPAANTQATITRAAGAAGVRHICRSISATLIGLAAAAEATVLVNLRDGATGAGTILRSWRFLVIGGVGSQVGVELSGLNIFGTAATAMTLEFAAAGGANTFETVALSGYDTL